MKSNLIDGMIHEEFNRTESLNGISHRNLFPSITFSLSTPPDSSSPPASLCHPASCFDLISETLAYLWDEILFEKSFSQSLKMEENMVEEKFSFRFVDVFLFVWELCNWSMRVYLQKNYLPLPVWRLNLFLLTFPRIYAWSQSFVNLD